jgi:hypothetical protein
MTSQSINTHAKDRYMEFEFALDAVRADLRADGRSTTFRECPPFIV